MGGSFSGPSRAGSCRDGKVIENAGADFPECVRSAHGLALASPEKLSAAAKLMTLASVLGLGAMYET